MANMRPVCTARDHSEPRLARFVRKMVSPNEHGSPGRDRSDRIEILSDAVGRKGLRVVKGVGAHYISRSLRPRPALCRYTVTTHDVT